MRASKIGSYARSYIAKIFADSRPWIWSQEEPPPTKGGGARLRLCRLLAIAEMATAKPGMTVEDVDKATQAIGSVIGEERYSFAMGNNPDGSSGEADRLLGLAVGGLGILGVGALALALSRRKKGPRQRVARGWRA
ncbi:MAG: hypothetical protein R3B09_32280 [Nannocystaceae bacterium]